MNIFTIALVAGLTGMLGWGISDFFAKKTIDKVGELKTLLGSQAIGGLCLLIYFLVIRGTIPTLTWPSVIYLAFLAFIDGLGYLLLYRSFRKGVVSVVSPICASAAAFTSVISVVIFHEQLSKFGIFGLIMIFMGIIVLSTDFKDLKKSFSMSNFSKGIPEALGSMVFVGLWFALWDRFVKGGDYLFWLILLKVVMSVFLVVYLWFSSRGKGLFAGYKGVSKTLFWVAALDAIAYLGTTWGYSKTLNATSLITMVANAYSVPTIVLAYLFLKERINKTQLFGIFSIIVGIVISSIK